MAGPKFAGRYELGDLLKSGSGIETYRAVDSDTGREVVVKTIILDAVHPAARLRFEHETRVLRELGDESVALLDAGCAEDRLYLVLPLVAGSSLEAVLRSGPPGLIEAVEIGWSVANSLEAAHAAGVCHRDVKPANIIVARAGDSTRATLIDYGFARSPWLDGTIRDELVGTARYLAPEAAGMLGGPTDERSDLYSLGVVLFECLTGSPPFTAETVGDLLRQHLTAPVPDLRSLGTTAPRAFEAIVQRLLRKEPAERYQSAAALAADLGDLLTALRGGDIDPPLVIGRHDQRDSLTDPAFVGRESELAALMALVRGLGSNQGGIVLLEAESGGGKTRLLSEVAHHAYQAGALVLRGGGVALAAQRPFTLLRGVADGLIEHARQHPDFVRELTDLAGDNAAEVVRALPALAEIIAVPDQGDTGPEQFGEQRSIAALRRLLLALANPDRRVLILLDDCQWSDTLTVRLLAELSAPDHRHLPFAVIAAFRSEEVPARHPLRHLPSLRTVALGPLPRRAMRELAESMAGPLPAAALDSVVRLADGSPFMTGAILRGFVECGALVASPAGWRYDDKAGQDLRTAQRAAAVLVRRLELLDDATLRLLSVGAVLGKSFDIDLAVLLAGSPIGAAAALDEARRRRLLWIDERTGRCNFFHDKIREALLDRTPEAAKRALHSRAADELTHDARASVFERAYHLDRAGRRTEAAPIALAAAETARKQHALDTAVEYYRIAQRGTLPDDSDARRTISEHLGDVLVLQGRYAEANTELTAARHLAATALQAASLDGRLGDLAFKQGDLTAAKARLEGAMALLGRPIPRHGVVLLLRLLWEAGVQLLHTAVPRFTTGRRDSATEADILAMRLHSRLAYLYWFHSGKVACGWTHLRGLNLVERYPPSPEMAQAYSEHAPVVTMLPWFSRGVRYARRSLQIRRDLGDTWGEGQSLSFLGVVYYSASRYDEAVEVCNEACRLLDRTGDRWEANTAAWHLALSHYRLGHLGAAADIARGVYESAKAISDNASAGIGLSALTRARCGRIDPVLIDAELARGDEDAHTSSELHLARALSLLRTDDLAAADAELRTAGELVRRASLRQEYVAPVAAWRATVLRRQVEAASPYEHDRASMLRQARKARREAMRWAASYRNNLPHALREAGLIDALCGRHRRARRHLSRSIAIAAAQNASYELALSRLALATASGAPGYDPIERASAAADVAALETLAELESPDAAPISIADRFSTLLHVGRLIASATTEDAVGAAVREAAITLVRGERCELLTAAEVSARLDDLSPAPADTISRTLLRRAMAQGGPVVSGDQAVDESESLLLSNARSVLAAPIKLYGEAHWCFYVTHGQVGMLFGEEEIQLAAFIATLAEAALEHVTGSEERYKSLARNSSDVVTLLDADGRVTYQGPAVARVFGIAPTQLVDTDVSEWVYPRDRGQFDRAIRAALRHGTATVEARLRQADGSYLDVATTITNLLDDESVNALVLNSRDISERRQLEERLRQRALHDTLTGLPNRSLFLDRTTQALSGQARARPPIIGFVDLDDFKAINDTLGHAAGDAVLRAIADRLVRCVRPTDTVARLGGDEFAILFEDAGLDVAEHTSRRILHQLDAPLQVQGTSVTVHASIGLAAAGSRDVGPEQVLAQADAAMYAAKAAGKGEYAIFTPSMQLARRAASRLRLELDAAINQNEFRLHYQPVVDVRSGSWFATEALLRWVHPKRGIIGPAEFIQMAEQSSRILAIGRWVLRVACSDATALTPANTMSVNVSARQLQDSGIVDAVEAALAESGLAPERLVLEITETATIADTSAAVARLRTLKSLGVKLALDDFGTGYAPLSYLRRFPVDYLKLDHSLVRNLPSSREDAAIVHGVIDMAHALGLRVVAEGVERPEHFELLAQLDCDYAQGWLWQRPVPLEELIQVSLPQQRHTKEKASHPRARQGSNLRPTA